MQRAACLVALAALSSVTPARGTAQPLADVLPAGAEVRFAVLGSFDRHSRGEVHSIDGCPYVRWTMGRDFILGVPLDDIVRMQINASDVDDERALDTVGSAEAWVEVDVAGVLQSRPERCRGEPFSKITPLHTGILIRP